MAFCATSRADNYLTVSMYSVIQYSCIKAPLSKLLLFISQLVFPRAGIKIDILPNGIALWGKPFNTLTREENTEFIGR